MYQWTEWPLRRQESRISTRKERTSRENQMTKQNRRGGRPKRERIEGRSGDATIRPVSCTRVEGEKEEGFRDMPSSCM